MRAIRATLFPGLPLAIYASAAAGQPAATPAPPRPAPATSASPSLTQCPRLKLQDYADRERKAPLSIPAAYSAVARANLNHIAVLTLSGASLCVSSAFMEAADGFRLTRDNRFLHFRWSGNEAGGYIIVDRTGRGQSLDVGAIPRFSPSRARFASIEISESGFGSLNGFLIIAAEPTQLRQLAKLTDIPILYDWRIDGWAGENCINLSAIPQDKVPENVAGIAKVTRTRYIARPGGRSWTFTRSASGCPAA